ncbi:MAG: diacylglycerol kinase family protein [Planctomycetaceae bacterium]
MDRTTISAENRLVVIQRNPRSGSGAGRRELLVLIRELRTAGYHVRMFRSRRTLDACLAVPENALTLRCIVAAGGDGTVADVANRHPGCPIAVLPLGTENLLAKYLNLPRCGRRLAAVIASGQIQMLDSATANGRRFLLMLSAGVDGDIVQAVHQARTGTIRRIGYVVPTLRAFASLSHQLIRASTSDGTHSATGTHIIVTNIPRYGFAMKFAPEAIPDDGLLNVRIYHGTTRWQLVWHAIRLKLGLPIYASECTRFTTTEVTLESVNESRLPGVQADGDPCSELPVRVVIKAASLCVLVRSE